MVQINLEKGALFLDRDTLGNGDRKLNVGAGDVTLTVTNSRSYASLKVYIASGELKDGLPGIGGSSTSMVSRTIDGSGKGHLELNVGSGTVELPDEEEERK